VLDEQDTKDMDETITTDGRATTPARARDISDDGSDHDRADPASAQLARTPGRGRTLLLVSLSKFSGLYLLAAFIVVFGVWSPDLFLTKTTLTSVASSQAIVAVLSMGLLVAFAAGQYDLSIGATANLATLIAITRLNDGWSVPEACAAALIASVIVGLGNAFLVVRLRINSFIATLGMATVLAAVQTIVTGGLQPVPPQNTSWGSWTQHQVSGFQVVILYMLAIGLVVWWLMEHTPLGRYIHAMGGNREAARLAGVRVDRYTAVSLVLASSIAGVAGVLFGSLNGPSVTYGSALLLPAFAAVFLGSTQITPGRFNVWGTVLALYVLAAGVQGLQYVTGEQWISDMFNGVALIGAVAFAGWRTVGRSRS
jgi:ribose transport system permease protein